jgi:D-arabinose 1-dehydrogenase-like Zn-dependent alcohol dehydrogenase
MYKTKAYSAASATSPLASTNIERREPTAHDVQIEILFCGICHSDLHQVRNEWSTISLMPNALGVLVNLPAAVKRDAVDLPPASASVR